MTHGGVVRGFLGDLLRLGALMVLLNSTACSGPPVVAGTSNASGGITPLTAQEAGALIAARSGQAGFIILDVRTPEEFAAGHIAGAVNLCLTCASPAFADAASALDKSASYLVYCHSGNRSATATAILRGQGFASLYELTGGTVAWQAAGLPLVQ